MEPWTLINMPSMAGNVGLTAITILIAHLISAHISDAVVFTMTGKRVETTGEVTEMRRSDT